MFINYLQTWLVVAKIAAKYVEKRKNILLCFCLTVKVTTKFQTTYLYPHTDKYINIST